MRAVIQRVSEAVVRSGERETGRIGPGLLVLLGVQSRDTPDDARWLAGKIVRMRVFPDESGNMNRSVIESGGDVLVVSQFTLIASTRKGNRPSFNDAAPPDEAVPLYETFLRETEILLGKAAQTGLFGAMMNVGLVNDGPVTLVIDSRLRE